MLALFTDPVADFGTDGPALDDSITQLLELDPLALVESDGVRVRKLVCVQGVAYQADISPVIDGAEKIDGAVVAFRNFDGSPRSTGTSLGLMRAASCSIVTLAFVIVRRQSSISRIVHARPEQML